MPFPPPGRLPDAPPGFRSRGLLLLLVLLVAALPGAPLAADLREVTILHTTDLHGHVESGAESGGGGWLRAASVIRDVRREAGAANCLLIDTGDTIQGSPVATHTRGEVCRVLIEQIDYDVWVPGNHEFDFGAARFGEVADALRSRLLCGNLGVRRGRDTRFFPGVREFTRNGVRIAVLGCTASYMREWMRGERSGDYVVTTAVAMLGEALPAVLRAKPDLIVLAIHQGWLESDPREVNEIREIVRLYPEIDLILGGHTHRYRPGMKLGVSTWYSQSGMYGDRVGVVRATVDIERHEVVEIRSSLAAAGGETEPDAGAATAVAGFLAETRAVTERRIGSLSVPLAASGTPGVDCPVSELFCRALADASGAEAVLHGTLSEAGLPAGAVSAGDLFAVVPYENTIMVARVTPRELEEIVTEQLRNRGSYVFCGPWGVRFRVDGEGAARIDGPPPRAERYVLALNSYTAAGGGGRFPRLKEILDDPRAELRDLHTNTRDAVAAYLQAHPDLALEPASWLRFP